MAEQASSARRFIYPPSLSRHSWSPLTT